MRWPFRPSWTGCTTLEEKDSSNAADKEHLKTTHLEEMKLEDAALKDK